MLFLYFATICKCWPGLSRDFVRRSYSLPRLIIGKCWTALLLFCIYYLSFLSFCWRTEWPSECYYYQFLKRWFPYFYLDINTFVTDRLQCIYKIISNYLSTRFSQSSSRIACGWTSCNTFQMLRWAPITDRHTQFGNAAAQTLWYDAALGNCAYKVIGVVDLIRCNTRLCVGRARFVHNRFVCAAGKTQIFTSICSIWNSRRIV